MPPRTRSRSSNRRRRNRSPSPPSPPSPPKKVKKEEYSAIACPTHGIRYRPAWCDTCDECTHNRAVCIRHGAQDLKCESCEQCREAKEYQEEQTPQNKRKEKEKEKEKKEPTPKRQKRDWIDEDEEYEQEDEEEEEDAITEEEEKPLPKSFSLGHEEDEEEQEHQEDAEVEEEEEEEGEVEEIVGHRASPEDGSIEFDVKWKNCEKRTWEPKKGFVKQVPETVEVYEQWQDLRPEWKGASRMYSVSNRFGDRTWYPPAVVHQTEIYRKWLKSMKSWDHIHTRQLCVRGNMEKQYAFAGNDDDKSLVVWLTFEECIELGWDDHLRWLGNCMQNYDDIAALKRKWEGNPHFDALWTIIANCANNGVTARYWAFECLHPSKRYLKHAGVFKLSDKEVEESGYCQLCLASGKRLTHFVSDIGKVGADCAKRLEVYREVAKVVFSDVKEEGKAEAIEFARDTMMEVSRKYKRLRRRRHQDDDDELEGDDKACVEEIVSRAFRLGAENLKRKQKDAAVIVDDPEEKE
jgi:hypothetical protein